MMKLGTKVQKPGQFDDPNSTCANIGLLNSLDIISLRVHPCSGGFEKT